MTGRYILTCNIFIHVKSFNSIRTIYKNIHIQRTIVINEGEIENDDENGKSNTLMIVQGHSPYLFAYISMLCMYAYENF